MPRSLRRTLVRNHTVLCQRHSSIYTDSAFEICGTPKSHAEIRTENGGTSLSGRTCGLRTGCSWLNGYFSGTTQKRSVESCFSLPARMYIFLASKHSSKSWSQILHFANSIEGSYGFLWNAITQNTERFPKKNEPFAI